MNTYQQKINRLAALPRIPLDDIFVCGLERETMRVDAQGVIADTQHPEKLGLALTNKYITTDFAESLIELVTPPFNNTNDMIGFSKSLHSFIATNLGGEYLWPASMPPILPDPENFNIATYGKSHQGQLRHIYRRGLSIRYGRRMQAIAGVHFNLSLGAKFQEYYNEIQGDNIKGDNIKGGSIKGNNTQEDRIAADAKNNYHNPLCRNTIYLNILRNYIRKSWLINYLFGSSPIVDKSFLQGQDVPSFLKKFGKSSYYNDKSTCLRMGRLGYNNRKQVELNVCFNKIEEYISTIKKLTAKSDEQYATLGIKDAQGEYQQLNTNLLQIENEYYAPIRPKAVRRHDQKTLDVLMENGTEYLEIRNLDIDPFSPWGIDEDCIRFMQLFLLYLSLEPSPSISREECQSIRKLEDVIVMTNLDSDRDYDFIGNNVLNISDSASSVLAEMQPLAEYLDSCPTSSKGGFSYTDALAKQKDVIDNDELLPAKRQLKFLKDLTGGGGRGSTGNLASGDEYLGGDFSEGMNNLAQQHLHTYQEHIKTDEYKKFAPDIEEQVARSIKEEQEILAQQKSDKPMGEVITEYLG
ncbi:MAG: glutamate--cysteine ligase [Candidatus Portiera sp.]|nr:glutamate--cysteine ligase [Portiera sp.]